MVMLPSVRNEIRAELDDRLQAADRLSAESGPSWMAETATLLGKIDLDRKQEFRALYQDFRFGLGGAYTEMAWRRMKQMIADAVSDLRDDSEQPANSAVSVLTADRRPPQDPNPGAHPAAAITLPRQDVLPRLDARKVFVVYGRNLAPYQAMVHFLRALGLDVLAFEEVAASCGGSAFIGDIVRDGMERAQGVIVLLTPDEYSTLAARLVQPIDTAEEVARWQARPNVIFEAGMALGIAEPRTILVSVGVGGSPFSDISGRHIVRLDNRPEARALLRDKLIRIGCSVDTTRTDWASPRFAGDFSPAVQSPTTEEIKRVVTERMSVLVAAFESRLRRNLLRGKIVVAWTVLPSGRTAAIDIVEDTVGDNDLQAHVQAFVAGLVFPKLDRPCDIRFPFVFEYGK